MRHSGSRAEALRLKEPLGDFAACISVAAACAPNGFPSWSDGYQAHMHVLKDLWTEIRPQLKCSIEHIIFVEAKLKEMISAFDGREVAIGTHAARALLDTDLARWADGQYESSDGLLARKLLSSDKWNSV